MRIKFIAAVTSLFIAMTAQAEIKIEQITASYTLRTSSMKIVTPEDLPITNPVTGVVTFLNPAIEIDGSQYGVLWSSGEGFCKLAGMRMIGESSSRAGEHYHAGVALDELSNIERISIFEGSVSTIDLVNCKPR